MEILPQVGWANAIPDAIADVDLTLDGTPIKFTGVGYHDSTSPSPLIIHLGSRSDF
jgi:hypothetical protein